MPELQPVPKANKKKIRAIGGGIIVIISVTLLIIFYPWLQLKLAEQLMEAGKYSLAEPILVSLTANKPNRTTIVYKLVACQLFQEKGREAAQTVLSLTGVRDMDDLELAIIFTDVSKYLMNTGYGDAALELARRVRTQSEGEMLKVAVKEISFAIAKYSDLPLALEAVNLALAQGSNNWLINQKAFNLLLTKALEAAPQLAEPALDRALELYPNNIIAVTRKASIIGDKRGPKEALEFLLQRENELADSITPEYLATKRILLLRLAGADPKASLTQYTQGIPRDMIVEIAKQGLNHAWLHNTSGRQYYYLAPDEPPVAYQYGRNLVQMHLWDAAGDIFRQLEELAPNYADFRAIAAALDAETKISTRTMGTGELCDTALLSPDGKWLAWRRWREHPQEQIMVSDLVLSDLTSSGSSHLSLGDTILFKWSPDSKHLALQTMTSTGLGRLSILVLEDGSRYFLPPEYDVIDFNWANHDLMVQAQYQHGTVLLRLTPPKWTLVSRPWELNSDVNSDFSWLQAKGNILLIYKEQQELKRFTFETELMSFTSWSPAGNLALVEDMAGKIWIYNHKAGTITPIAVPGRFAAWGRENDFFWYLPLWDQTQVLVRLNSLGKLLEYYPYSFEFSYLEISVAADGSALSYLEDNRIVVKYK